MDLNFNIYSLFLIFFGLITIILSCYIYKKESGAVRFFGFMMFSNSIWSIGYGFELACTQLKDAVIFNNIEYIGIAYMPLHWILFCTRLTGVELLKKSRASFALLASFSTIVLLLVWTNPLHHFYFSNFSMEHGEKITLLNLNMGPGYWIFTFYFYGVLAYGCYLLLTKFRKSDPLYKNQHYSIVIALSIPLFANILYMIGIRPFGNLDLTPFAFTASVLLITAGIYRFKLFDIVPVARERVLELVEDGFVILDHKKRIIDYNKVFGKYLEDFARQQIAGSFISEVLPGQTVLFDFLEHRQSGILELNLTKGQESLDVEADVRYLNEHQTGHDVIIIKFRDLTPMKEEALKIRLQAIELQKLNQLKDRIFSIISHDLRGPLVNLSEVLKMINNNEMSAEEFKLLSPTLNKDIIYTTDLLENILHWSRSQLEGYGIRKEFFDLKAVVVNEVSYHAAAATAKKIEIIQDVFPGAQVYADVLMIQIVIRNLLSNAIKFCHENSVIQLSSVFTKDNFMQLHIRDTGIGISKEVLDKLFSGENYSSRGTMNEKGTGLGLVVCKEFIEKNGGKMRVESEPGKGSSFYIDIPVA
ncbi:sensor histidine kinase [Pedobacter sp. GR22-6]|uniref:sensor histidine kinase n=1 Tax=Pedobacter sp. GR22-6 TaxID=3127957 RepID=UPI00307D2943